MTFIKAGEGKDSSNRPSAQPVLAVALGLILFLPLGCGSSSTKTSTVPPTQNPSQLYFSPSMGHDSLATYALDHTAGTFVRSTYSAAGSNITDSGVIAVSGDVVNLGLTYVNGNNGSVTLQTPVSAGWAVELPGQAALVQLAAPQITTTSGYVIPAVNYFSPAVPTQSCPDLAKAETFQFVTIPKPLSPPADAAIINPSFWNPLLETAYGSANIGTTGTSVAFNSVSQFTLPAVNGGQPGTPSNAPPSVSGIVCATTYYGQVISVPGTGTVTNPGGNETLSATATIGIGPSGFLVEDAGSTTAEGLPYQNILGAGYGAIGLPQPASDLTSALVGAQYQGFAYAPGGTSAAFNLISSFGGYSAQATSCASLLSQIAAANLTPSSNTIYGGEYTINSATPNPAGTGNCDLAVDLGTQASGGNGLYTSATVYVSSAFPANGLGSLYSFQAVVIGGQLNGKNALFLIGADTTGMPSRAWGIYLLQSN